MSFLEYSEDLARWNPKMGHQRHKCHFCKSLTTSFFCAVNHAKRHKMGLEPFHCQTNGVEKYFCRNCNCTTDLTTEFKHHISKFHAKTQSDVGSDQVSQSYWCDKCGFETYSILNWLKHVSNHHQSDKVVNPQSDPPQNKDETQWYTCDQCEYKTQERGDLNEHRLGHIKLYKCNECGHTIYKNITPSQIELKHVVTWYKCERCRDKTREKLPLEQHNTISYLEYREFYWYECDKCSFRSKHNVDLKLHNETAHSRDCEVDQINSTCTFNCESSTLRQHEPKHVLLWYKCEKCSFRTKHNASLTFHYNTTHAKKYNEPKHQRDLEKQCDICSYLLDNNILNLDFDSQQNTDETPQENYDLKQHEQTHIDWYRCNRCPYRVKRILLLQQHIINDHLQDHEIHWFECGICTYKAKESVHLKLHYSIKHAKDSGPRRIMPTFKCDSCPKVTNRKSPLNEHVATIHRAGNDAHWLKCGKCDFRAKHIVYLHIHDLEKHWKQLGCISWYKCRRCDYKTDKTCTLRQHERKHNVSSNAHDLEK